MIIINISKLLVVIRFHRFAEWQSVAKPLLGPFCTSNYFHLSPHIRLNSSSNANVAEMIIIRFAGWISGRIVSLQPDKDIQKLLSNWNRIRIRISETLLPIFRRFRLLEKVAYCTIFNLLSSEASFQLSMTPSLSMV